MKIKIDNYTFDKTSKTVTFTDYTTIRLDCILLVTNVTSNIIIYNFANPLLGGTVSTNTLRVAYDTVSMNNTDNLQIFYEDSNYTASTDETLQTLNNLIETLSETNQRLSSLGSAMSAGAPALRTIPIASVSTAITGTVTSVISTQGGYPAWVIPTSQNNLTAIIANINNIT